MGGGPVLRTWLRAPWAAGPSPAGALHQRRSLLPCPVALVIRTLSRRRSSSRWWPTMRRFACCPCARWLRVLVGTRAAQSGVSAGL